MWVALAFTGSGSAFCLFLSLFRTLNLSPSLNLGGHAQAPVTQPTSIAVPERECALSVVKSPLDRRDLVLVPGMAVLLSSPRIGCNVIFLAWGVGGGGEKGSCWVW